MHGNVWEWYQDGWHDDYKGAPINGSAWSSQSDNNYLLRGGSWDYIPEACRSACRNINHAGFDFNNVGFRVVCGAAWT